MKTLGMILRRVQKAITKIKKEQLKLKKEALPEPKGDISVVNGIPANSEDIEVPEVPDTPLIMGETPLMYPSIVVQTPPGPIPQRDPSSLDPSRREVFRTLYDKLFMHSRDGRNFFADLSEASKSDKSLPLHSDAWLYHLGYWKSSLCTLQGLIELKKQTPSDEAEIAEFLEGLLPRLSDHGYLHRVSPAFTLDDGRRIVFSSLFECFARLGEGGATQVIAPILAGIGGLSGKDEVKLVSPEPSRITLHPGSRPALANRPSSAGRTLQDALEDTLGTIGANTLESFMDQPPSERVIRIAQRVSNIIGLPLDPKYLIENAFGDILLSSSSTLAHLRDQLSSIFPSSDLYPYGKFCEEKLRDGQIVTES